MKGRRSIFALVLLLPALATALAPRQAATAADPPREMIYLDKSRDWAIFAGGKVHEGQLAREIVRQALLIAARDELSLVTRDALLGDEMPARGENQPLEVAAGPGAASAQGAAKPSLIEILQGFYPVQARIGRYELAAGERSSPPNYAQLVTQMEELSRGSFVAVLTEAGFSGEPHDQDSTAEVPDDVERLLAELTFTSQYLAVRKLHNSIRSDGESPALLAGLVRGYANLGVLTEFYWHPAHKVFKARALLYAERLLRRGRDGMLARWHSGYALALAGLPRDALAHLQAAQKSLDDPRQKGEPVRPAWADLVRAFCQYDVERLKAEPTDKSLVGLAGLLRFLAFEKAGSNHLAIETGRDLLVKMPECYRVAEGLSNYGGMGLSHEATSAALKSIAEKLYPRLEAMPGLPSPVQQAIRNRGSDVGLVRRLMGRTKPTAGDEFATRGKVVAALRASAKPASAAAGPVAKAVRVVTQEQKPAASETDRQEPSWAVLGQLIEEATFVQVWKRVRFERNGLGTTPNVLLANSRPVVAGHPYRLMLESYAWQLDRQERAIRQMAAEWPAWAEDIQLQSAQTCDVLAELAETQGAECRELARSHMDATVGDLMLTIETSEPKDRVAHARQLQQISPDSPYARAVLIDEDWPNTKKQARKWEQEAAHHPAVLLALGRRYFQLEQYDDAERMLKRVVTVSPHRAAYEVLAEVYRVADRPEEFQATLDEYLERPEDALGHAGVRVKLARFFIERKEYERAKPYADRALSSDTSWAMMTASWCYEGLQDWRAAEQWVKQAAERDADLRLFWYFFCKRTGHGDLAAARGMAEAHLARLNPRADSELMFRAAIFYLLEGKPEKALEIFERLVAKGTNPYLGLHVAIAADQLNRPERRDGALRRIEADEDQQVRPVAGGRQKTLVVLAGHLLQDLARGGRGELNPAAVEKLRGGGNALEQMEFNYFLGKYLDLRGKRDEAVAYWKLCMDCPLMSEYNRTLAGAELVGRGVRIDSYSRRDKP